MASDSGNKKPGRRWYQFRLRTLLVLFTIAAVAMAFFSQKIRQQYREQAVIEWVQQKQGSVAFEYYEYLDEYDYSDPSDQDWQLWTHTQTFIMTGSALDLEEVGYWQRWTGLWTPGPVKGVELGRQLPIDSTKATITDISRLAQLPELDHLTLDNTDVHDLTPLAELTALRLLRLQGTKVTDLTPLANLDNLRILYLMDTQVEDLSPLHELSNLEVVILDRAPVSHEQVEMLKKALPTCSIFGPKRPGKEDGE